MPDRVDSIDEYHARILEPLYAAIAPHDPAGVLRGEWLNSRGAIARFDRGAIEIRILDAQECPAADLVIAHAVTSVVRELFEERHVTRALQRAVPTAALADVFERSLRDGDRTEIATPSVLAALGLPPTPTTAGVVWQALATRGKLLADSEFAEPLGHLLQRGPLARWLLTQTPAQPTRDQLRALYRRLCAALDGNHICSD